MLMLSMKKIIIGIILAISMSSMLLADTYVNGYYKSNGTYVQGITDLLQTPQEAIIGVKEEILTLTLANKVQETPVELLV